MGGPTGPLYLLLISLVTADALRVTMEAPLISVKRDENVTIPCKISDFSPGKTITVSWTKIQNGMTSDVYSYIPGRPQDHRPGSYMEEESEIQRGNAALHLPRAQFSDDGEYTCTVIVTPESREGTSILQVSAAPSAALIPGGDIKVELGSEKVVSCDVSNFYPKDINIRWVQYEKGSSQCVVLERGTCTSDTINNADGTFNISSQLTLYPKMEDDGSRYSCGVKHRALQRDLMMNFTLTVTEREDNSGTVVAAIVGTILVMTLLLLAALLYYQVFNKDPPSLSEISGNDRLIDMNRTILTCNIMNFKPNDLEITVYLKRRGENMMVVHTWRSRDANTGEGRVDRDIEQQRLMNGDVSHTQGPLDLEMNPVITPNRSGLLRCIPWSRLYIYSCQCSIHITPSFHDDDGAEFSVHVSHPALTEPVSRQRTLRVIGVPPSLLKIVSPALVTHEEPTTLTCPITGFKPKPLQITWLTKYQDDRETELVTWNSNDGIDTKGDIHRVTEDEHKDKSYSFQSALTMKPNVREDGVKYICRTFHPATDHRAEEELVLNVTAVPVLDPIKLLQDKVYAKDTMKLSCKIHSFYPAPIDITWCTEDGRVQPSIISDVLPDTSGLYHVTSTMSYTPTMKDRGKIFTCKVTHQSTGAPRKTTWKLEDLVSVPAVTEIRCDPPAPESGRIVTLSCDISELYPYELTVQWYKGRHRMTLDKCSERLHEDPESGTFQGTVELKFTANPGCHEEDYRMELIYCRKVIERKFRLILGDFSRFPVLSDIISDPSNPSYGQSVTLHCKVTNTNPKDIEVKWLKGEKPLKKGQGVEKQITEKDGSVSCSLQITVTALDYAKAFTCSVEHKNMTAPLKKNHYITLPDKAPMFSDITVLETPVAGKEAAFIVTISGFTPEIRVKWYKDFNPFPSDVVTTSDPQIGKDFLCTCSSTLRFTPQDNDHEASIRCEATHSVTKKVHEQQYTLHLSGRSSRESAERPPRSTPDPGRLKLPLKTGGIQCLTESPRVGDKVTLTCYVDGCDADNAEFFWRKGMFPIDSEIQNRTLEDGSGSFSTVTFTAQETDRDCTITCEVNYNFETQEEHFTLKLQK